MADIATLGIKVETKGVEAGTRALDQLSKGAKTAETAVKQMEAGAKNASGATLRMAQPMAAAGRSAEQTARQMRMLAVQMPDVVSGVLSGQSAFQLLVQQGGQVYQQFQMGPGGVGGALRNVGGALRSLVTPARLAGGALTAGAAAGIALYTQYEAKIIGLQRALNGLGAASGLTAARLANLAAANANGLSVGSATSAAATFAQAGLSPAQIASLTRSTRGYSRAFGMSTDEAAGELAAAFKDPIKGAQELNKRFGTLSPALQRQIELQNKAGDLEGARNTLQRAYNDALSRTTQEVGTFQGMVDKAKVALSNLADEAAKRVYKAFAPPTGMDQLRYGFNHLTRDRFQRGQFVREFNPKAVDSIKSGIAQLWGDFIAEGVRQFNAQDIRRTQKAQSAASLAQQIAPELFTKAELTAQRDNLSKAIADPEVLKKMGISAEQAMTALSRFQAAIDNFRTPLERIKEDGALATQAALAMTAQQRMVADVETARVQTLRQTNDVLQAAQAAENARALAIANSTRALSEAARTTKEEAALIGLRGSERERKRVEFRIDALRRDTDIGAMPAGAGSVSAPVAAAATRLASGFNSVFAARLAQLQQQFPELRMTSGVRSHDEQAALRAKYGSGAARPGTSRHEVGLAADFSGRGLSSERKAAIIAAAEAMGLQVLDSNHGALHVQGPRTWAGKTATTAVSPQAMATARPDVNGIAAQMLGNFDKNRMLDFTRGLVDPLKESEDILRAQKDSIGKSNVEREKAIQYAKLLNETTRQHGEAFTQSVLKPLDAAAERYGKLQEAQRQFNEAQQKTISQLDELRSTTSDLISSPLKAIAERKNPGEALRMAGLRAAGRMIEGGSNGIAEMLFGQRGKQGGGIFGNILGKNMMAANMQVQAGNVIVTGGIPGVGSLLGAGTGGPMNLAGATGGGMGLFSLIGKLFGFANGGIMTSNGPLPLRKYAKGGIATSPQVAVFGEGRHNEAFVPLPDGHSIPVRFEQKRQAISAGRGAGQTFNMGGISLNVQGNADNAAIDRMKAELAQAQAQQSKELRRDFGSMLQNWQNNYA